MGIEPNRQALADVVESIIGITVILAEGTPAGDDQPREDQPYATLSEQVTSGNFGPDERFVGPTSGGGSAQMISRGHRWGTFDLNVFGLDASDFISTFKDEFFWQENMDLATSLEIDVLDVNDTTGLTSLLDTAHEERASAEVTIGYVREKIREVDTLEGVEATGTLTDESGTIATVIVET